MKVIGYWWSKYESEWPHPRYFVGDWPGDDKEKVLAYMAAGNEGNSYKGWSDCRMCGQMNGSSDVHDDEWLWPIGLPHYVLAHSVVLPQEFINHVRTNNYTIPQAKPRSMREMLSSVNYEDKEDLTFWRSYTREATMRTIAENEEPPDDSVKILQEILSKRWNG